MTTDEALSICAAWLRHLDRQRDKALKLQQLAALARTGPEGHREAQRRKLEMDLEPRAFDGANLEPAVRHLMDVAQRAELP